MQEEQTRCPLCGSETSAAASDDPTAIHQQIERLQERLRELDAAEHSVPHSTGLYGGYGGDDPEPIEGGQE
jgi:hypothetical protein